MNKPKDDLEAVRLVADALEGFDAAEQERILRWAREKLGLTRAPPASPPPGGGTVQVHHVAPERSTDIKTFISSKNPKSNVQFAAAVAYYYRFEAPEAQRKDVITAEDLKEATRKVNRERLAQPIQTLRNALTLGYLDKGGDRGTYQLNTVGENLVSMTLPANGTAKPRAKRGRGRTTKKKKK